MLDSAEGAGLDKGQFTSDGADIARSTQSDDHLARRRSENVAAAENERIVGQDTDELHRQESIKEKKHRTKKEAVAWGLTGALFFLCTIVYAGIFMISILIIDDLSVVKELLECQIGGTCNGDAECIRDAVSMLVLGVTGMMLFGNLTVLTFALPRALSHECDKNADEPVRATQEFSSSRHPFHLSRFHSSDLNQESWRPTSNQSPLRRGSSAVQRQSSNFLSSGDNEAVAWSSDEGMIDSGSSDGEGSVEVELGQAGSSSPRRQSRIYQNSIGLQRMRAMASTYENASQYYMIRPFSKLSCLCDRLQCFCRPCVGQFDPVHYIIPVRKPSTFDFSCTANWATIGAKMCMFPWYALVLTCTFVIVGKTSPSNLGDSVGVCDILRNQSKLEKRPGRRNAYLNSLDVYLTWVVVVCTWVALGTLCFVSVLRTIWKARQLEK